MVSSIPRAVHVRGRTIRGKESFRTARLALRLLFISVWLASHVFFKLVTNFVEFVPRSGGHGVVKFVFEGAPNQLARLATPHTSLTAACPHAERGHQTPKKQQLGCRDLNPDNRLQRSMSWPIERHPNRRTILKV
jgi:hypothetical protein